MTHGATDASASTAADPAAAASSPDVWRATRLLPLSLGACLLLAAATLFMRSGALDRDAFVAVQGWTVAVPDAVWSTITIGGAGVVAIALLAPALATAPRFFAAGLVAAATAGLYSTMLKHLFALPRPAVVLDAAQVHVVGHALRANTFPSGHSVAAFALASVVVFASRRPLVAAAWAMPCAIAVAVSRIAVGAHWPADLAAGAAGGWLCGAAGVAAVARWRGWNVEPGIRAMAFVAVGLGVSLFVVDLGYPLAVFAQRLVGVVAIGCGAFAMVRPRRDRALPLAPPHPSTTSASASTARPAP